MEAQFRSENYDAGITGAVDALLGIYRSHLGSTRQNSYGAAPVQRPVRSYGGGGISMFWWIIIVVVGFLILRSILRAMSAPRYYGAPPGTPGAGTPPTGASYGPGYGPGYGYGGGGSFWSGLLGGLGGAWLGNELFRGGGTQAGQLPPDAGGGWGGGDSGGGWQSDAGQTDMGSASGGDWSGGGFGDAGGGGDFGGGDSGGGW
jgi:hypothetical protein